MTRRSKRELERAVRDLDDDGDGGEDRAVVCECETDPGERGETLIVIPESVTDQWERTPGEYLAEDREVSGI